MPGAEEFVPSRARLPGLREAVQGCRGCGLYRDAAQAVFGAGPETAKVVVIGEQPGDQEDRRGEPFVGPAGGMLDRALAEAGIRRDAVYVTNTTKHFKFERTSGKRRIHRKPSQAEVDACRPWLDAELRVVAPRLVICLGATAAQAMLGTSFRVTKERGIVLDLPDRDAHVLATIHPSAILRSDDREAMYQGFVADLRVAARALRSLDAG
ncbi:UdgX family uracil-DNA binding protein [Saccharopolyspora shandongensis]|uniref:UdgX family uracil-DNA binding protein n=1 Tax=Saccharopolyspora shandongensis TaxID=418495 RepID=UPI0034099D70